MNQIVLDTMDGKPVSFVGGLHSQTEEKVEFTDGIDRKFILKVYTIETGGFVPTIEYASNEPSEKTGCIAEILDLFKDIESFYFVFVPDELLPSTTGKSREEVDSSNRLAIALRKTYERLTFAYLDELSEAFGESPDEQEIAETNKFNSE